MGLKSSKRHCTNDSFETHRMTIFKEPRLGEMFLDPPQSISISGNGAKSTLFDLKTLLHTSQV